VLGAVGQPRDGNPAACYAMVDTAQLGVTWHRVPYDIAAAAAKIRAAGLPGALAERLFLGR
jgi:diadenosine tetraphosphatase ApaH/serine/threonine PP2A family protein phosphatase